jgi:hypothetical protein
VSLSASASSEGRPEVDGQMTVLQYLDVLLILFAAPVLLLIGVPAVGYCVGAAAWIALRAVGVVVDRKARTIGDVSRELTFRLLYVLARVMLLALTIILVRRGAGKDDGLTALVVIAVAFTIELGISIVNRPRPRR